MKTIKFFWVKAIMCLLLIQVAKAQTGNPNWCVPNEYVHNITGIPLPTAAGTYDYHGGSTVSPSNMYCDASGNILFFVADARVYNRYGHVISQLSYTANASGTPTPEDCVGWSKVCIVPHPDSCTKYYIFTEFDYTGSSDYSISCGYSGGYGTGGLHRPVYAQIDMAQGTPNNPGEYGLNLYASSPTASVTTKDLYLSTSTVASSTTTAGCSPYPGDMSYACTRLLAGSYRLLFVNNGSEILTYKIDVNGITFLYNYALDVLSGYYAGGGVSTLGTNMTELEVYEDSINNRIKVALVGNDDYINNTSGVGMMLMDFNFSTGAYVSSTAKNICLSGNCGNPSGSDSVVFVHGLEFSPNGKYVYALHRPSASVPYVLNAYLYSTPTTSYNITPTNISDFRYSQMEMGTDTALYLVGWHGGVSNPRLAKITSPSAPSNATANFADNQLTMSWTGAPATDHSGYVFFLPDQIDHQNYAAVLNANSACCIQYESYDKMTYTVTGANHNQVWTANTSTATANNPVALSTNLTSTVTIGEELRIPAGYTVTARNMTFQFSPVATFVVEGSSGGTNSGQLILKKCTLTVDNRCVNKMWPGVRVWGDKTITRSNTNQGYIFVDSLSVITNARIGVELGYDTWDVTYDASNVPTPSTYTNAGGGMIVTTNSSFINNERGIVFCAYPTNSGSASMFTTTFTTTTSLIDPTVSPRYFIGEYNYNPSNTKIQGCTFGGGYYALLDTGIYSINSNYSVSKYTTGSIWNTMREMSYGVWSTNTSGNTTVSIKETKFLDNLTGVYLGGINNATIDTDSLKLFNCSTFFCPYSRSIGVFLDNCYGYKMQNSIFDTYTTGSKTLYGLIISNSGAHVNCAYNNQFKNLTRGIQMQYVNYINQVPTPHNAGGGLVNMCNTFTNISSADMYVPSYTATANVSLNAGYSYTCTTCYSGIHHDQGTGQSGQYPATTNNLFSHTTGGYDVWIDTLTLAYISNWWYCNTGTCSVNYNPVKRKNATVSGYAGLENCALSPYSNGLRMADPVKAVLASADLAKVEYDSLKNSIANVSTNSPVYSETYSMMGNVLNKRHRFIDEAIHMLLDDPDDSTSYYVDSLTWLKAMDLPARSRLESAVNISDSSKAAQALNDVISEEGTTDYVRVYTVLVRNLHKTPAQIMADPNNLSIMQDVDNNKSDVSAYVKANLLLHSVGLSHYQPIVQDTLSDEGSGVGRLSKQSVPIYENNLVNLPNPFNSLTTIKATVNKKTDNAFVVITDLLGKELGRIKVYEGENQFDFNATESNGQVLFATLVIDGVKIKTNKMVLIK